MTRLAISVLTLVAVLALSVSVAFAKTSGAHFMPDTGAGINDAGALVVTIDEAGVGNQTVDYTLTADSQATFACINGGEKHPKAANKETVSKTVTTGGTFSPTNGRVSATLTAGPPGAGSFSCPPGQTLVLASVSYSDIVLTDTTNGVSTNLGSVSRTFFKV
jgi:hypothetical protein